jgi:nucleotide-binding universal stress UspA family protein
MFKRILVPTDASEFSKRALKAAVEMARIMGSEIVLLHVIYSPNFSGDSIRPTGKLHR